MVTQKTFDAAEFLAFCRGKPADRAYPVGDPTKCALAQFGFPGVGTYEAKKLGMGELYPDAITTSPHTFGSLADRLEAALAEQSGS